jgi:hypothetical protein
MRANGARQRQAPEGRDCRYYGGGKADGDGTKRSDRRRHASTVRRAGRFRLVSQGEACGAMGSGRDRASSGSAFLGGKACKPYTAVLTSSVAAQPRPQGAFIWERSDWAL